MNRAILVAAALAGSLAAVPAGAQQVPERIKGAGKVVIATMPNYPPITFKDPATNVLTGVDIELGEAIGRELGLKVEWQEIAFAQMISSLTTGRVDMVMAGMSDTPARRETVDFVNYMRSGPQFYVAAGRASEFPNPVALCGKNVGASRSTNWPKQIEAWSQANCVAAGKPAMNVVGTEGSADARTQIKTGRLDGAVQGSETLPYIMKNEPNTFHVLGEPFGESITGIAVKKEDAALRDAIQVALERLREKGAYDAVLAKYDLPAAGLPKITINQGK